MNSGRQSAIWLVQRVPWFITGLVLASIATWLGWCTVAAVWRAVR